MGYEKLEEVMVHLTNDNVRLHAEVKALRHAFHLLLSRIDSTYDRAKGQEQQDAAVLAYEQEIVLSHPLYQEYWKKKLKGDLGELGVSLSPE